MIAYIRNSFFLLFFLLSGLQASAQNPVQVNVFLTPPYAVKLSDYTAPGTSKLQAQLLLRDLTVPERQVRLRLVLSNGSATLSTKATFRPMPLYLQGGLPLFLTGDDLAPYLDPNNLDFGGSLTRQQYQRLGTLPEGFWTFSIQVIDYQRGNVISNTGTATAWLMYNEPPLLNLPANKSTARILDPQNIVFQWTPRHTASPNAVGNVEYEFTLVEIYPSGREANNAMQAANPIYQTTTRQTTLVYGITETPLTPGREYAWKVRAIDGSGLDLFRNQGNSEVWMFQYGETCSTPTGLTATTNQSNRIDLNWNQSDAHSSYTIQYRPQGWNKWYSTTSPINKLTLTNLDPETTYEIQVAATCGPFTSDLTDPRRVTTPERYEAEYTCGQPLPSIDKSNRNPATDLAIGSLIYAADFDVQLTSVWEQEGKFSGTGYTAVPLFNNARVNVTFQNVLINTDHRLVEGYLKVVNGTVQILNDDQLEQLAELREELNATLNTIDQNLNQLETLAGYLDDFLTGLSALDDPPDLFTAEERAYIESMNDEEKIAYAQTLIEEGSALLESDNARDRERGEKKLRQARAILNEAGQQEGNALITTRIDWANGANATHGFDATGADAIQRWYEQIPIGDGLYQIPWKAVKTGQPEEVQATLQSETEGLSLADLQFTLEGRTLSIQQDQSAPTEGRLSVLSTVTEQKQQLKATHPQEGEEEQLLGILNVIAYDGLQKRLVLVPVNNNDAGLSQTAVQNTLNDIYGQAAVNWTVRVEESFAYPYESFNTGESGLLSNYSADMRALIRQYKQEKGSTIDEDSYYLFLLPEGGIQGYMPRAKQFGFLFTQGQGSEELATTIAHELGHGAFHLQHIFTEYGIPEGSTDNLMDYAGGRRLHKYQWDHIHHPQTVIGFLEEDEAGEYYSKEKLIAFLNLIKENNEKYVNSTYSPGKKAFLELDNGVVTAEDLLDQVYIDWLKEGSIFSMISDITGGQDPSDAQINTFFENLEFDETGLPSINAWNQFIQPLLGETTPPDNLVEHPANDIALPSTNDQSPILLASRMPLTLEGVGEVQVTLRGFSVTDNILTLHATKEYVDGGVILTFFNALEAWGSDLADKYYDRKAFELSFFGEPDEVEAAIEWLSMSSTIQLGGVTDVADNRVVIRVTRERSNDHLTIGRISVDGGVIEGGVMELGKGTDAQAQSGCNTEQKIRGNCRRIQAGTYNITINNIGSKYKYYNRSIRVHGVPGRSGILLHPGNSWDWTYGCLLTVYDEQLDAILDDPGSVSEASLGIGEVDVDNEGKFILAAIVEYIDKRKLNYSGTEEFQILIEIVDNDPASSLEVDLGLFSKKFEAGNFFYDNYFKMCKTFVRTTTVKKILMEQLGTQINQVGENAKKYLTDEHSSGTIKTADEAIKWVNEEVAAQLSEKIQLNWSSETWKNKLKSLKGDVTSDLQSWIEEQYHEGMDEDLKREIISFALRNAISRDYSSFTDALIRQSDVDKVAKDIKDSSLQELEAFAEELFDTTGE